MVPLTGHSYIFNYDPEEVDLIYCQMWQVTVTLTSHDTFPTFTSMIDERKILITEFALPNIRSRGPFHSHTNTGIWVVQFLSCLKDLTNTTKSESWTVLDIYWKYQFIFVYSFVDRKNDTWAACSFAPALDQTARVVPAIISVTEPNSTSFFLS